MFGFLCIDLGSAQGENHTFLPEGQQQERLSGERAAGEARVIIFLVRCSRSATPSLNFSVPSAPRGHSHMDISLVLLYKNTQK